jgi:hypothetical protein
MLFIALSTNHIILLHEPTHWGVVDFDYGKIKGKRSFMMDVKFYLRAQSQVARPFVLTPPSCG